MMREETIAYLAGFFDGEGCIRVHSNNAGVKRGHSRVHRLIIVAAQRTDHSEPLKLLRETFGGSICSNWVRAGCQPVSRWTQSGEKAALALKEMLPYLLVKKSPAMLGIAFQTSKEMIRLYRRPRTRLSEWEIVLNDTFMKAFSLMNGNKPLEEIPSLPPARPEDVVTFDQIN